MDHVALDDDLVARDFDVDDDDYDEYVCLLWWEPQIHLMMMMMLMMLLHFSYIATSEHIWAKYFLDLKLLIMSADSDSEPTTTRYYTLHEDF
jgi:hypothetical protein